MEINYQYEVAFSFLKEDEGLAIQLSDLIQDRFKTFIYSKQQEDIAGTDGEITFNEVFGIKSRVVVVLYRKKWGTTPWTRIEETAIRNRAFDEGYDFVLFIPLDTPQAVPKYLPKSQIWVGLDRWGIKGAASVIEARVQSMGGEAKEESPRDIAERIKRDEVFERERELFLRSAEGVKVAKQELEQIYRELEKIKNEIELTIKNIPIGFSIKDVNCSFFCGNRSVKCIWIEKYWDTLEESFLNVIFQIPSRTYYPPIIVSETKYLFDINRSKEYGWTKEMDRSIFTSSKSLAQVLMKHLLNEVMKEREADNSNRYL